MKVSDFIAVLQDDNPTYAPQQNWELEELIEAYPFFQAARALYTKGLQHLDSDQYPEVLKATASYTPNREVLFDYMTLEEFAQHRLASAIAARMSKPEAKEVLLTGSTALQDAADLPEGVSSPLPSEEAETLPSNEPQPPSTPPQSALGRAVASRKDEKHVFTVWLQLTQNPVAQDLAAMEALAKRKKFALLDKFIENNPKIVPKKGVQPRVNVEASTQIDKNELMTETLARVYVAQKKYKKAIQAFKILSLKYPEKSGFFADQIREVKRLQQQNP